MTKPSEGDRYRDEGDVLWTVANPHHHSGSGQGIVFESEDSGMTLRLSDEGFRQRREAAHLVPADRDEEASQ